MKKLLYLIFIGMFFINFSYANKIKSDIKIGILAKRGVEKALKKWNPTAEYLNAYYKGKYNFTIVPMKFDEIDMLVSNTLVDFVIVNSAIYVNLSVKYGVTRIATLKNRMNNATEVTKFGSVVFTKKDSKIKKFIDLENKKIAAVHPTSLGGWIMAKRELKDHGIEEFKRLSFLNTHDAVVFSVLNNESDAGVVRTDTLEAMKGEKKIDIDAIKVINQRKYENFPFYSSSRLYPEWPIAKLENTCKKIAKDITIALMKMDPDSDAAIASNINGWTIPEDYSSVHDILKTLNLSPYEDYGKISLRSVLDQYWYWGVGIVLIIVILIWNIRYFLSLINKLKEDQQKILQNDEIFRSTFDQSGIGIIHMDFRGDFIKINQQFCKFVGKTQIEILKSNFSDFIFKSDLSTVIVALEKLKDTNESKIELTIRIYKDEEPFWIVLTLSKVVSKSEESYIVATIVDVNELKKLESKINDEKIQKELILNIAGDGILGLDKEGRHTFINPSAADLLGYEIEEMIGEDSHTLWHHSYPDGSHFPSSKCPITSVLKDGITHRGQDEVFWRKDNTPIKVDFISTPIVQDDDIVGTVVLFRLVEKRSGNKKIV